jgi:hypothetical protein
MLDELTGGAAVGVTHDPTTPCPETRIHTLARRWVSGRDEAAHESRAGARVEPPKRAYMRGG